MDKIGLFGGAFDPIHQGHLHIALLAWQKLHLDKVYFIPLHQAVHKSQPVLSPAERLAKIQIAITPYPAFDLDLTDFRRQGPSYAIETVRHFRRNFTASDLYYIIGTDAFEQFFSWKEPEELLSLTRFIVVARPGYDFAKIEKLFAQRPQDSLDRLFFIEDEGIAVSSTEIREKLYGHKNRNNNN
jgi:nicotinate-nucleotide adenylyltransferase